MTEPEWQRYKYPHEMLALHGVGSPRKRRLFAVECCCRVWNHITDERCQRMVRAAEEMADKDDSTEEWDHWNEMQDSLSEFDARQTEVGELDPAQRGAREVLLAVFELVHPSIAGLAERVSQHTLAVRSWQEWSGEMQAQADVLREIFGNPFRPVIIRPAWRTTDVMLIARQMYESRNFGVMPILADALQDAGCDSDDILNHCRGLGPHVRGCWVVDLVLGKQ